MNPAALDLREYSTFTSTIDLIEQSPNGARPARYLRVVDAGSGVLSLRLASNNNATRTLTGVVDGQEIEGAFTRILSATNCNQVLVGW